MKSHIAILLTAVLPMFAATPAPSPIGYPATKITSRSWDVLLNTFTPHEIARGTPATTVKATLGQPRETLSADVWVYDNCEPNDADMRARNCTLLLVTFSGGTVAEMKFVNRPMADLVAANMRASQAQHVAANK